MTPLSSKTELDSADKKLIVEQSKTIWHELLLFKEEVMGEKVMENFELNKNFDEIKYRLNQLFDKELFMSNYDGMLLLSFMGSALIDNSGFIPIFEQEKDKINARIEFKYEPKTKYAVQDAAYKFMSRHSACENSPFNALKKYSYEKGKDYSQILRAGSILVRNYYLEKHPEIKE